VDPRGPFFRDDRSPMQRYITSYHEAGHVVVGVLLRWAIREVSIIPEEDSAGRVRHPRKSELDYWLAEEVANLLQGSSKKNGHNEHASLPITSLTGPPSHPDRYLTLIEREVRHSSIN
jgi:hypothetical protein